MIPVWNSDIEGVPAWLVDASDISFHGKQDWNGDASIRVMYSTDNIGVMVNIPASMIDDEAASRRCCEKEMAIFRKSRATP